MTPPTFEEGRILLISGCVLFLFYRCVQNNQGQTKHRVAHLGHSPHAGLFLAVHAFTIIITFTIPHPRKTRVTKKQRLLNDLRTTSTNNKQKRERKSELNLFYFFFFLASHPLCAIERERNITDTTNKDYFATVNELMNDVMNNYNNKEFSTWIKHAMLGKMLVVYDDREGKD